MQNFVGTNKEYYGIFDILKPKKLVQNRVQPIHLQTLDHTILPSVKNNLKVEYFCQKDLQ